MTYNISVKLQKLGRVTELLTKAECKFEMGGQQDIRYWSKGTYKVQEVLLCTSDWQEVHRTLVKGGMLRLFHQGITEYI